MSKVLNGFKIHKMAATSPLSPYAKAKGELATSSARTRLSWERTSFWNYICSAAPNFGKTRRQITSTLVEHRYQVVCKLQAIWLGVQGARTNNPISKTQTGLD